MEFFFSPLQRTFGDESIARREVGAAHSPLSVRVQSADALGSAAGVKTQELDKQFEGRPNQITK